MTQNTFTNNVSENFADPGNWSLGHVPNSGEDAEIDGYAVENNTETVASIGTAATDGLSIDDGASLFAFDGTGPNANDGGIGLVDADLFLGNGTFDNPGTIDLNGVNSSLAPELVITGSITLKGVGTVEMAIGTGGQAGPADNFIVGDNASTTPTLLNLDNTIAGDGTIEGLNFINDGFIDTDNGSNPNGGIVQIAGTADGGSFINYSAMFINNGGELLFGLSADDTTVDNEGSIIFQGGANLTTLAVTGAVTISATGDGGRIEMEGSTPANDSIVTLGQDAALILVKQTLDGAGSIDDAHLSLDLWSGTIEADVPNQELFVRPATLTNDGTLGAFFGGELVLDGPVTNNGIIAVAGAGSVVDIFNLGVVAGSGIFKISTGGSLHVDGSASGLFGFVGPDATILIGSAGVLQGTINGMEASDAIDVAGVAFASGIQAVWQQNGSTGTLSLVNNGSTLAAFTLSGQYSSADFSASADGEGGTLIQVINPAPPAATTADMIMRDDGDYEIFDLGSNAIQAAYPLGQIDPEWQVAGVGGFNGADTSDMILRDSINGAFQVEDISNNNITNAVAMGQVGLEWSVAGFGDFSSRAGETDMLMRNSNTGAFEIYDISNNTITSAASMGQVGLEWTVAGFGDFSTRPNETDMLMRNTFTGAFEIYDISDNQLTSAASMGQVGLEWAVAGFGDFSANPNETDMLMRNSNTGAFEIYDISSNTITSAAPMGQVGLEWQVAGFGPINGAGTSDMLMRNTNTGAFEVYDITNNQLTAAASMGQVGPEWSVAGIAADPPTGVPNSQLAQAMASFDSAGGVPFEAPMPDPLTVSSAAPGLSAKPALSSPNA